MENNSVKNKRIAKNTAFLYIRMLFVLIITLYTSRVILNVLGVEDFGVYNVVSGFVTLFSFLNVTLSSSMQRFYNYEMGVNQEDGIRRIYSLGLKIHGLLVLVLFIILETVGLWYINNVMVVPTERIIAANCVYQASLASMLLMVATIPYTGAILAFEKMDFFSFVSILDVIFKLFIVLILPFLPYDKLIIYSILLFVVSAINFSFYFIYSYLKIKCLRYKRSDDKGLFREMMKFSGWNLLGTFAYMINEQGLNMLLNFFFGPVVNAARGVSFQASAAISSFSGNITMAFRPQVVSSYASGDKSRVSKLFYIENKVCFNFVLFLSIPLIMEITQILRLWLGEAVPPQTGLFTVLVLLNKIISSVNPIIGQVAFATGRIKRYQIANSVVNIMLIPMSFLLLLCGLSATSVFILTIIVSVINQAVCLIELNRVFYLDLNKYVKEVILPCIIVLVVSFVPQFFIHSFMDESLMRLCITFGIEGVVCIPMFYFIVLNCEEKTIAKKYIMGFINKIYRIC